MSQTSHVIQMKRRRPGAWLVGLSKALPTAPAVVLIAIFLCVPICWAIYSSLTNSSLTGVLAKNPAFVGLENYGQLLQDPDFPKSFLLTVALIVWSAIVGQNLLGLSISMSALRAHAIPRKLSSLVTVAAWAIPDIVGCYCAYAFFAEDGTFKSAASSVGLSVPSMLYEHPMLAIIIANIWRGTAFSMMVYSAALNSIPGELIEAAKLDGASSLQVFFHVTIPMIKRSILTNLMLTTLQTLSVFSLILVMTGGGPGTNSSTLPVLAYQQAFKFSKVGYGTAISVVMLIIGAVFSVIYMRMLKTKD